MRLNHFFIARCNFNEVNVSILLRYYVKRKSSVHLPQVAESFFFKNWNRYSFSFFSYFFVAKSPLCSLLQENIFIILFGVRPTSYMIFFPILFMALSPAFFTKLVDVFLNVVTKPLWVSPILFTPIPVSIFGLALFTTNCSPSSFRNVFSHPHLFHQDESHSELF